MDIEAVKSQVISLLNLNARDTAGVPVYTSSVTGGDTIYAQEEIDQAVDSALLSFMRAICETDGHPDRVRFTTRESLDHGEPLPEHYGSVGVPDITPFSGAGYTLQGKIKSVQQIQAYRANPNGYYSETEHDEAGGSVLVPIPSKLAGFYAIDEAAQVFYFTGQTAEADLVFYNLADHIQLPDDYMQGVVSQAITNLNKDGNVSDIFGSHANIANYELQLIRQKVSDQPSPRKTVGSRESGTV